MSKPWKRLAAFLPGETPPRDGDTALQALAAVAEVRRLVDQAELAAVRTARTAGRSWTEIATMLAITRQSAWERWRDLDDTVTTVDDEIDAADEAVAAASQGVPARARRRGRVAVPDVTGFTVAEALAVLTGLGLLAESATPEIELFEAPDDLKPTVVVRQYPDPGTPVRAATTVRLWLERGDGEAGVREPRRPSPPPRAARADLDDDVVEAVG